MRIAAPFTFTAALLLVATSCSAGTTPATSAGPATVNTPAAQTGDATDAAAVLAGLTVAADHYDGYDRDLFTHWGDADGDQCDTRAEVLIRDSATDAQIDTYRCHVVAGDWTSPYDGATWDDPSRVDVDHVVALAEAWRSGAWAWDPVTREQYANDLGDRRSLRAVTDTVNQDKSDSDPATWLPDLGRCAYVADWLAIKARWSLSVDPAEHQAISDLLATVCVGTTVASWEPAPIILDDSGLTVAVSPSGADSGPWRNCADARAAGAAPLTPASPRWNPRLDGDGDGKACE